MTTPLDPFALEFDSIEIDRARAPSAAAFDHALSVATPAEEFNAPGFYLLDDAGGRFVIDRDFGVVSLRDEAILEREHNDVFVASIKVIEHSGASYEMALTLRLTGRVPQVVGAEDLALLAGLSDTAIAATIETAPAPRPTIDWAAYAPSTADHAPSSIADEEAPFGALLAPELPRRIGGSAFLALDEAPPAPSPRHAHWAI